jgi:hypothetical protein
MSVEKVINKSFIVWGKKFTDKIKVVCKWTVDEVKYRNFLVVIDFEKYKREWYVTYFEGNKVYSCTIDDISGSTSMTIYDL